MTDLNLGEKLKMRRKEKRLTLAVLGELSGVDTSMLARIESGKRAPSARTLQKLAGHLGYGEAELLKMAGYLSPDRTDERIDRFKESLKGEIRDTLSSLIEKVDTL